MTTSTTQAHLDTIDQNLNWKWGESSTIIETRDPYTRSLIEI